MKKMYIGFHVKYLLFLSDFNETLIFSPYFQKNSIIFHENLSSGSQIVPCGWTERRDKINSCFLQFCECA